MDKELETKEWEEMLDIFHEEFEKEGLNESYQVKITSLAPKYDDFTSMQVIKKSNDGINIVVANIPLSIVKRMICKDKQDFFNKMIKSLKNEGI